MTPTAALQSAPPQGRAAAAAWASEVLDATDLSDLPALIDRVALADTHALRALLAEGRRRAAQDDAWQPAVTTLNRALTDQHAAERRGVIEAATDGTLRLRVLRLLGAYPLRSKAVAEALSAPEPLVSRTLTALRKEGLVAFEHLPEDGRARLYRLTAEGEQAQLRWGTPSPVQREVQPAEVVAAEEIDHELARAVHRRRCDDALDQASAAFALCIDRADDLADKGLWLRAVVERAVTQRQAGQTRAHQQTMQTLEEVALATRPEHASVSTRAMAHVLYERGRLSGTAPERRFGDLRAAATLFQTLAAHDRNAVDDAFNREVWASFGIAELLREQTAFGAALELANACGERFAAQGDAYGATCSLVLAGFCLRLRGQVADATRVLELAVERGREAGLERLRINAAIQLGETYRAAGEIDRAADVLGHAVTTASAADMVVSHAFASCHLGAVEHDRDEQRAASTLLADAERLFERARHRPGMALALRRHATVTRRSAQRRATLEAAASMLVRARRRYTDAGSPAGVIACGVERGHVALTANASVAKIVAELDRGLRDADDHKFLVLDPWVPDLVHDFATRAEAEGAAGAARLRERSSNLRAAAEASTTVEHHEWSWVRQAAGIDSASAGGAPAGDRVDEMAGEHRRRSALVSEPLLAGLMQAA